MKPLIFVGLAATKSLNAHSSSLLLSITKMMPENSLYSAIDIKNFPFYDPEDKQDEIPCSVYAARKKVQEADAVIITFTEQSYGIPGILKNALEWLSDSLEISALAGKPVFFVSHSRNESGGIRAQHQLRDTLASMLCLLAPLREYAIGSYDRKIAEGQLVDPVSLEQLRLQFEAFLRFVYKISD